MAARTTIYDVAQRAGVSKSLVSLVLRGSDHVSAAKRTAVTRAIADLGYQPSRLASGLAGAQTRSIGVIIDDFRNLWFTLLLEGLQEGLAEAPYSLSVADLSLNRHLGLDAVSAFGAMRVDGLVVAAEPTGLDAALARTPHVIVGGRERGGANSVAVANDDVRGGTLLTQHLLGLGHRDIRFVTGPGEAARRRAQGYRIAMDEAGLHAGVIDAGETTEPAAYPAAAALLDSGRLPTAIIAANDTMAIGVLGAMRERGLSAPDDISVTGYDNSPTAASRYMSLTTVDGRDHEVGQAAARALLAAIAGKRPPEEILVPPELVIRNSTGAPPSSAAR